MTTKTDDKHGGQKGIEFPKPVHKHPTPAVKAPPFDVVNESYIGSGGKKPAPKG